MSILKNVSEFSVFPEIQTKTSFIPLSFNQERLWFIDQLEGSIQYHLPVVWRLKGDLNKEALSHALQSIVDRHEVLHTMIIEEEGQAFQSIIGTKGWRLEIIEDSLYQESHQHLTQLIQELIRTPFNLSKDHKIRASLISLADDNYVLVVVMHHIASDGWSMSVIVKEVAELYSAYVEKRLVQLSPLSVQYADYAIWQRNYLQGEVLERKLNYWKQKLSGPVPLQLLTDHPRPAEWSTRGASAFFSINKDLSEQLQKLSQQQGTTLYMTLLAVFKVMLHRYSGQQDICVGSPVANRTQQEVEGLIGFFVNTLALRSEVKSEASFTELLQQVKVTMLEAYEHQDVPFEKVVEAVVKERDLSRNPLFQVMFTLQNTPEVSELHLGEVKLSGIAYENLTAQFDITLDITETAAGLQGSVEYATDLYNESTILRMINHFKELLSSVIPSPQQKIGDLSMLTKAEEQQLLVEFNDTAVDYPKDKTIVDLFEEQVVKTPDYPAVIFEEQQLTYKELNERANQLAHELLNSGVKEGKNVPIIMSESIDYLVCFIAILKTGASCVPLTIDWPLERIELILKELNPLVILINMQTNSIKAFLEDKYNFKNINYRDLNTVHADINNSLPDSIMCVFYTSGSTGIPKGVEIYHNGIANRFFWMNDYFNFKTKSVLKTTTNIFDSSIWQLLWPLINGGKTVLGVENQSYDLDNIFTLIETHKITTIDFSPALFKHFVEDISKNEFSYNITSLKDIIIGGEAINVRDINKFKTYYPHIRITNLYGPTEASIGCVYYQINENNYKTIPIGIPIANTQIYICDNNLQIVPVGIAGEIHIAGVCLARGYLNLPKLTAEKFIRDPFNQKAGNRLYKTGDLGRWLPDGNIEYLGRRDDQVKVRGYRIELGEIENVIQQSNLVKHSVVGAKRDNTGNNGLVGYIVPDGSLNLDSLKAYLKNKLPEYMIPTMWVELEKLPITPNGKIDKKALPDFDASELLGNKYVAPGNEVEEKLAAIWQELLSVEQAGIHDNFFELGGHSLVVLQIVNRVRKLGYEIQAKDLFKYQTIEQQSKFISTSLKLIDAAREGKFVIPIQPEGNNTPLFAFPEYLLYSKIGKHISKNQPFYSIERSPYETFKDIVNHYIAEIKKIYPRGPYILIGYCNWAKVAVEMAQTLIAQGDEVPVLVLIEYYNPKIKISRFSLKFMRNKSKFIIKKLRENASLSYKKKFLSKEFVYALKYMNQKISRLGLKNSGSITKVYTGKVILFQASETYGFKNDSHMGWHEIFTGEVKKFIIEEEHLGLMVGPASTAKMAEILNEELVKTN